MKFVFCCAVFILVSGAASAQAYKCVDPKTNKSVYMDSPCPTSARTDKIEHRDATSRAATQSSLLKDTDPETARLRADEQRAKSALESAKIDLRLSAGYTDPAAKQAVYDKAVYLHGRWEIAYESLLMRTDPVAARKFQLARKEREQEAKMEALALQTAAAQQQAAAARADADRANQQAAIARQEADFAAQEARNAQNQAINAQNQAINAQNQANRARNTPQLVITPGGRTLHCQNGFCN